ncbi:MAG: DUF4129 domain-containing protein [Defluviitaleaceae bacterium]|nr:DUF4129 domain-containing protein [Defluviitaleaceae bacterium]
MTFYEAMNEVLQSRRYNRLAGRSRDIMQEVRDAIARLINNLLDSINMPAINFEGSGRDISSIATVFIVVGVVAAIVATVVIIRNLRRRQEEYGLYDMFEELTQKRYSVKDLLALSQVAKNRREAVRYSYVAALLALDQKGVITISPAATNRIIAGEIQSAAPQLMPMFAQLVNIFHLAWFGKKDISDQALSSFAEAVAILTGEKS